MKCTCGTEERHTDACWINNRRAIYSILNSMNIATLEAHETAIRELAKEIERLKNDKR